MRTINYAELFKAFRLAKKMTQVDLADRFETTQSRISKIEIGRVDPDANEILHFMWLAGESPYEVLDRIHRPIDAKRKKAVTA